MRFRIILGGIGILAIGYGGVRILANSKETDPTALLKWLVAVVIVHDGIIAPLTCLIGFLLSRWVKPRARRYLQAALIVSAFLTAIAVPEIHRRGSKPVAQAWLLQDYQRNLAILVGITAGLALAGYLIAVARSRRQTKHRPSA